MHSRDSAGPTARQSSMKVRLVYHRNGIQCLSHAVNIHGRLFKGYIVGIASNVHALPSWHSHSPVDL